MNENDSYIKEASISKDRYFNEGYFSRKQFDTLASQLIEIYSLKPNKILEIGVGNGFVSSFLRSSGIDITTFDINSNLAPNVIGNVIDIDKYFHHNSYDLIVCCEVLEHIPFEHFEAIIKKISEISSCNVLLTLPRKHRIILDLKVFLKIPFIKPLKSNIFFRIPDRKKWDGHFWEIDFDPEYSLNKVTKILAKYFVINKSYVNETVRHHQYFILKTIKR